MCEASGKNFNVLLDLHDLVGSKRFRIVCGELGGYRIRIPQNPDTFFSRLQMLKALESGDIKRLSRQGWVRALRKKYGLSLPYIRKVVNGCFRNPTKGRAASS